MSSDRPSNRKHTSKRASVSPKSAAKKRPPTTRTVDNLEALLHILDKEAVPTAAAASDAKSRKPTSSGAAKPARKKPAPAKSESPFMQELARLRDDLHREHRVISELQELLTCSEEAVREREALADHLRKAAADLESSGLEWQERFRLERKAREQIEQALFEQAEQSEIAAVAFETAKQALQVDVTALREQVADIERLQTATVNMKKDLAAAHEQLSSIGSQLADAELDRDAARQREAEALRRGNELSDEVQSLQASVQREAAARRKAEAVHKREAGSNEASALFEAEQRIERLTRELAASRSVESAYQQKAARKVQQVKQELESVRRRLAEFEQRPEAG